ncbi:GTP-binding protein [uncultured Sulfitobacter sp.]|uniref:CobW family GTP-binding protein n=1 Tax=uncultured Sulfitobacter sp. TaxID=191468 RepID=UPI00261465F1|nr:GTP-binding protein [uncultured Sulfitobacter sp.]
MTSQIPVTVLGGYLGSGKTTMVNHLLRHADGVRLAVLVNEFGELAIDEDLIEAEDDDIISIAGGCVCCSFGSDLSGALMEMAQLDPPPDHLVIESSGVAIPSAIVGSVSLLDGFRTDGIVIVADAETIEANAQSKYMSDTVLRQLSDANIIVLNKTDLVTGKALAATLDWLETQNPDVSVLKAVQGAVPMAAVLDRFAAQPATSGPHHHTENLEMTVLTPDNPVDVEKLAQELASDARGLVRAKGFATAPSGQKMLIQVVGNRWDVSDAADHMADGIVCLGYKAGLS